jgi:hypothetical protein
MADKKRPADSDANKYIRPDPKPHIDHEKEAKQRRIWNKALDLLEMGDVSGFVKTLNDAGLTSEQRARLRELVRKKYGPSVPGV